MSCTDKDAAKALVDSSITLDMEDKRYSVLTFEQVKRLNSVLQEALPIHGRGNFPTLEVRLCDLVSLVRAKLEADAVTVRDVRLNGGAASYILLAGEEDGREEQRQEASYNDLDLIFAVELSTSRSYEKVKTAVLDALLDFLPEGVSKKRMSSCAMKEGYVHKMVKVHHPDGGGGDADKWSLIALSNRAGARNIELKFVDTMKRQFEFSVDSFQIVLDSLLLFYDCAGKMPIAENFYPTVVGESVFGDFTEALHHLHKRLIATNKPEEIRGGGLLKYCQLLAKGYAAAQPDRIKLLERYMCSRFFIDFSDVLQQQTKLESYLWNHLGGADEGLRYEYLRTLRKVVNESTVCLMGHEHRQTLNLIDDFACRVFYSDQQSRYSKQQQSPSPASSCSSINSHSSRKNSSNSSSNSSSRSDLHIAPPPPVIYSNGYYYAPIVPAAAPPAYTCTCGWLQCA